MPLFCSPSQFYFVKVSNSRLEIISPQKLSQVPLQGPVISSVMGERHWQSCFIGQRVLSPSPSPFQALHPHFDIAQMFSYMQCAAHFVNYRFTSFNSENSLPLFLYFPHFTWLFLSSETLISWQLDLPDWFSTTLFSQILVSYSSSFTFWDFF